MSIRASDRFEYATIEWLWDQSQIRCNLPGGRETVVQGTYAELVETMTQLGNDGWDAATCASGGNWLFWTMRRATGGSTSALS